MKSAKKRKPEICMKGPLMKAAPMPTLPLPTNIHYPNSNGLIILPQLPKRDMEALEKVLDELLIRANGLTEVEPQRALDLYCKAKKANPNLNLFNEQQTAKTLKQSALTADFNAQHFIDKYDVTKSEADSPWKLAEEASCPGGRFGKPDPKVVLALVVRGGFAPAARMAAVDSVYQHYQNGIVKPFNICDYVTSGYGMSFCASRDNKEDS